MILASVVAPLCHVPVMADPTPTTDLVARALAGDNHAFREIFELYGDSVRRFLRDMLRSTEAADEATQETFVRAHSRFANLRDHDKLVGWLLGIARLVGLERLRAQKRERLHDSLDGAQEHRSSLVSSSPSPVAQLLTAEADQMLASALESLDVERRQAMLLRVDHRLAYEQIADIMNWPLSKVKNEIHRARLQLRKQLANYTLGDKSE